MGANAGRPKAQGPDLRALSRENRMLRTQIDHLRAKFMAMQSVLLDLTKAKVVPAGSALAELAPIETHLTEGAKVTVLAFGGMHQRLGMPVPEFLSSFSAAGCNILFVKDHQQCWFNKGLLGLSASLPDTIDVLRGLIPERTQSLRCVGTSSGGFAAIYFGAHLGADKVLAFGAQTRILPKTFAKFAAADSRSDDFDFDAPEASLAKSLPAEIPANTQIHMYFSDENAHDRNQAEALSQRPNVHLVPVAQSAAHNVALVLKERGELAALLDKLATL